MASRSGRSTRKSPQGSLIAVLVAGSSFAIAGTLPAGVRPVRPQAPGPRSRAAAARIGHARAHTDLVWPSPQWVTRTVTAAGAGHIAQSSPTVARVGDRTIVAVGAENGYVYVLDAATGRELPGWPQRMAAPPGAAVPVESSPAIAWLDGPGKPPSIIVGSGSTWVPSSVGEVEAFRLDGTPRWVFHVGAAPGTAVGVISSPAVGDLSGNGQEDVVFGSWDHNLYALDPAGRPLAGFPYNTGDTIWSSPALYTLPGQVGAEIFIGSDASGEAYAAGGATRRCYGGFVRAYRYVDRRVEVVWSHCEDQVIWSSPAVGVINSTGRLAVVVGTGFYYQPFPADTDKVFAYYADNGAAVPGWPVSTPGPSLGSPAIGVIGPSGGPSVVETSWVCASPTRTGCFVGYRSEVEAWSGDGRLRWATKLAGPTDFASPVLVPLRGESTDDVLVGSPAGLYALAGSTGAYLFGTSGATRAATINPGCAVYNSVAVADLHGAGAASGWHVFEACGGPAPLGHAGEVADYRLPVQPGTAPAWPMFRAGPEHDGTAPA